MRYTEFRDQISVGLKRNPSGLTWPELKATLDLPYKTPCYTWIYRMEEEIGLTRTKEARGMVWRLGK